jgi:hypothetical protein
MFNKKIFIFLIYFIILNTFSLQFLKQSTLLKQLPKIKYNQINSIAKNSNYRFFNIIKNNRNYKDTLNIKDNFKLNIFNRFNFGFLNYKFLFLRNQLGNKINIEKEKNEIKVDKKNISIVNTIENKIENFTINKDKNLKGKEYIYLIKDIENMSQNNIYLTLFKKENIKIIKDLKQIIDKNKIDYKLEIKNLFSGDKYELDLVIFDKNVSSSFKATKQDSSIYIVSLDTKNKYKNYGLGKAFKTLIIHNIFENKDIKFIESFSTNNKFHKKFPGYLWMEFSCEEDNIFNCDSKKYILESKEINNKVAASYRLTRENYEKYYKNYDDLMLREFTKEAATKNLEEIISLIPAAKAIEKYLKKLALANFFIKHLKKTTIFSFFK